MRSCVVCGDKASKRELMRIVASRQGAVSWDPTGKMPGRGAYVCEDSACAASRISKGRLEHALRTKITDDDWAQLVEPLGAASVPR